MKHWSYLNPIRTLRVEDDVCETVQLFKPRKLGVACRYCGGHSSHYGNCITNFMQVSDDSQLPR